MPWYLCEYHAHPQWSATGKGEPGAYSSELWARGQRDANRVARIRGLGEKVLSMGRGCPTFHAYPSELILRRNDTRAKALEVVHAATFLAYVCMQAKLLLPYDVVGDEGIVHQTIHALANGSPTKRYVSIMLRHWEQRCPGWRAP